MPRYARFHAPGALVHVVSRFVNREFRCADATRRDRYLERLERVLARTDWTLCSYALMSSHSHLGLLAGEEPVWRLLKPLHTGVARDLNAMDRRLGPVFAERARTIVMAPERMGVLAPYLHNNPVRARIVDCASQSTWTSHRAWVGLDPCPGFLRADVGLRFAGFTADAAGRSAFDLLVRARAPDPRDPALSAQGVDEVRRACRRALLLPIELGGPADFAAGISQPILDAGDAPVRWPGPLPLVVDLVSTATGVSLEELRSPSRQRRIVRARRILAATVVLHLRRQASEVSPLVAISRSAVTALLREAAAVDAESRAVARIVRGDG